MTYTKFKENIVEKGFDTKKGVKKFLLRIGGFTIISALVFSFFVASIVNTVLGIGAMLLVFAMFFMILDYAQQDGNTYSSLLSISKYWWSCIPITLVLLGVLKLFNFV